MKKTLLWCTENRQPIVEDRLDSDKIGVWVAISRRRIIGPIFFNETIAPKRLQILFPFVGQLNYEINHAFFQQYRAAAHTDHRSMELLKGACGERLTSRGIWPPRSPDLSPPDVFLRGAAISKACENNPESIA
jgi:hypothetical protein